VVGVGGTEDESGQPASGQVPGRAAVTAVGGGRLGGGHGRRRQRAWARAQAWAVAAA
jgi:hypothetical protein